MLLNLFELLFLAFAVGTCAVTMALTPVFRAWRVWVTKRSAFVGKLFSCPYCLSHWIAFAAVLLFDVRVVESHVRYIGPVATFLMNAFILVALSAPVARLIYWAHSGISAPNNEDEEDEEDEETPLKVVQ